MNCKQGDLAMIVRCSHHEYLIGRLVEIVCVAPRSTFDLPNGVTHAGCGPRVWVVKSVGAPFENAKGDGMYGATADANLRPIRGDLLDDETTTSKELEAV